MIKRAIAVLLTGALATALTGCSATKKPMPVVQGTPETSTSAKAAAPDTSCNARASRKPAGALPEPGNMPAGTYMAQIQKRGRLVLGTSQDTLLFSSRNPFTGKVEGFDVDMGRQIAEAIFGDPDKLQIKVIAYDKRISSVQDGPDKNGVDIVADTMTANCDRWKQVDFSTIYYEAGQRVLVSKDSPVTKIEDLGGKKVCAAEGSTSFTNIGAVSTKPIAVALPAFGDCLVAFQQNEVDAVSTDDTILAGMAAQDPYAKVVGKKFTDEPYGMAISSQHKEFTQFVNAVLEKNKANGTWTKTYDKWLGSFGKAPQPPAAQWR
jgi:polar amino acid transport system substrate-binding protein